MDRFLRRAHARARAGRNRRARSSHSVIRTSDKISLAQGGVRHLLSFSVGSVRGNIQLG